MAYDDNVCLLLSLQGEGDDSGDRESDDEDEEDDLDHPEFLLSADGDPSGIQGIPSDAQARLEAFFEAAGTLHNFTHLFLLLHILFLFFFKIYGIGKNPY